MHFQVEMQENGRQNTFRDKETKKQGTVDIFSS